MSLAIERDQIIDGDWFCREVTQRAGIAGGHNLLMVEPMNPGGSPTRRRSIRMVGHPFPNGQTRIRRSALFGSPPAGSRASQTILRGKPALLPLADKRWLLCVAVEFRMQLVVIEHIATVGVEEGEQPPRDGG